MGSKTAHSSTPGRVVDGRGNLGPKPLSCQKVPLGGCRVISSFDWGYGVVRRGVAVLKLGFEEHGLQDGPCGDEIRKLVRQIDVGRTIHLRGSYQRLLVVRWDVPVARVFAWGGGCSKNNHKACGRGQAGSNPSTLVWSIQKGRGQASASLVASAARSGEVATSPWWLHRNWQKIPVWARYKARCNYRQVWWYRSTQWPRG